MLNFACVTLFICHAEVESERERFIHTSRQQAVWGSGFLFYFQSCWNGSLGAVAVHQSCRTCHNNRQWERTRRKKKNTKRFSRSVHINSMGTHPQRGRAHSCNVVLCLCMNNLNAPEFVSFFAFLVILINYAILCGARASTRSHSLPERIASTLHLPTIQAESRTRRCAIE